MIVRNKSERSHSFGVRRKALRNVRPNGSDRQSQRHRPASRLRVTGASPEQRVAPTTSVWATSDRNVAMSRQAASPQKLRKPRFKTPVPTTTVFPDKAASPVDRVESTTFQTYRVHEQITKTAAIIHKMSAEQRAGLVTLHCLNR